MSVMSKAHVERIVNELRDVCQKHNVVLVGIDSSQGILSEISIQSKTRPDIPAAFLGDIVGQVENPENIVKKGILGDFYVGSIG